MTHLRQVSEKKGRCANKLDEHATLPSVDLLDDIFVHFVHYTSLCNNSTISIN